MIEVKIPKAFKELFNPKWRYILYYGGRASGKSHSVARSLLIRGRQEKLRILCTREYQKSIKDSVHKLLSDIIDEYGLTDYEVQKQSITNTITGTEFIFSGLHNNVAEIKSMEGIDIAWAEECQSLTSESIDVLTPTIRKKGSQIIFTFNRITENDPVYKRFISSPPPKTYSKLVNYDILEKLGWLPDVIKQEMEDDKLNRNKLYKHKWLGEPLDESDMALISRESLYKAFEAKNEPLLPNAIIGADIARYGDDRTVIVVRNGNTIIHAEILNGKDTQTVARRIEQLADKYNVNDIKVDETGVGGGVIDAIRLNRPVTGVNFGGKANDTSKYINWVSEAWFNLADRIEALDLSWFNGKEEYESLIDELAGREWKVGAGGRSAIQSKDEFKKMFGRSPDIADSILLAFNQVPKTEWADANTLL